MFMEPKTLREAILYFADAANCREYLVARRWPEGVVCPRCGSGNVLFLEKYNRWECRQKHPSKQFTLKTGTVMEDSPIGLDKWMPALWLLVNCKNGVSSYEIHRDLGVTQKSAWFMLHRLRLAMENRSFMRMGLEGGPVEADETFVGGKPKNMHLQRRKLAKNGNFHTDKPAVFGMLDRETRQVRAKVIPNVKREVLQNEILDQVVKGSKVFTDGWKGYNGLADDFVHDTVNHLQEYVRGEVHTQGIENFWSLLKRTLNGTYVAVEPFHLDRYVGEQVFRYNNRATKENPLTDADRFALATIQIVGKRLTYAQLTGKEGADQPF
jgi:transposase-like protein